MRYRLRLALIGAAGLIGWLAPAAPAAAVEYRLRVVSIPETAYASFLRRGESDNGASGPGLENLQTTLDRGDFPFGPVLFDRRVQPVRESLGRAYGGARVIPAVKSGGDGTSVVYDEMIWEGKPGEHSVWVLLPSILYFQEVYNVALRGTGPLRNYQPYSFPMNGGTVQAALIPLNFVWAQEDRGTIWSKYLSHRLDLTSNIGVLIGVNTNPMWPDHAYIITRHTEEPTTYEAVVVWRQRKIDRQAPGGQNMIIR
jgi:hypothetical protein